MEANTTKKSFNGPALLAAMFRGLDPLFRAQLITKLSQVSPILVRTIELLEFQFADLFRLEDKGMQYFLSQVNEIDLATACKIIPDALREKIERNLSPRRREQLIEDLATMKQIHKKDVYRTQMQLARLAKNLLCQGKLRISSRRDN